jgi:ADP-heptose:LPS heptosyltransferase
MFHCNLRAVKVKKILIVRYSSMGDIVLTSPVYRCLKLKYPEIEIHVLVKSNFAFIHSKNPYINKVWETSGSGLELIEKLQNESFDFVADLQNNSKSNALVSALGVASQKLEKHNVKKWFQVVFNIQSIQIPHIVQRYIQVFDSLELEIDDEGLDFFLPKENDIDQVVPFDYATENALVLVVGGAHEGKKWSPERFQDLLRLLKDQRVVLIGGKEDEYPFELENNQLNLIGKCSVFQSAQIVANSEVVITGDTGMMHIAAALKKNIISLWGCTTPSLGMHVFRGKGMVGANLHTVTIQSKRTLRPCSKLGNRCKYGMNNKCIDVIQAADVYEALLHLQKQKE